MAELLVIYVYSYYVIVKSILLLRAWKLDLSHILNIDQQNYHIMGKFVGGEFGEFGELFMIRQTKTIHINTYN